MPPSVQDAALGCGNPYECDAAKAASLLDRMVGEPVAYVQAPRAKGHRTVSYGFQLPDHQDQGATFAGAHRGPALREKIQ